MSAIDCPAGGAKVPLPRVVEGGQVSPDALSPITIANQRVPEGFNVATGTLDNARFIQTK